MQSPLEEMDIPIKPYIEGKPPFVCCRECVEVAKTAVLNSQDSTAYGHTDQK